MPQCARPPVFYYPPLPRIPNNLVIASGLADRLTAIPLAWCSGERANLIYMTERACSTGMLELANQLIAFQSTYQFYQGRFDDHERLVHLLAETAGSTGKAGIMVDTRLRLARLAAHRGDHSPAMAMVQQTLGAL